jgi:hypothetical protein
MMVGLILYAYSNGVFSSRKIEAATGGGGHRQLAVVEKGQVIVAAAVTADRGVAGRYPVSQKRQTKGRSDRNDHSVLDIPSVSPVA